MSRFDQAGGPICATTSAMRVWSTLGHVTYADVGGRGPDASEAMTIVDGGGSVVMEISPSGVGGYTLTSTRRGGDHDAFQSPFVPLPSRHASRASHRDSPPHAARLQRGVPAAPADGGAAGGRASDPGRRRPRGAEARPEAPRLPG